MDDTNDADAFRIYVLLSSASQTEFVAEEFETGVTEETTTRLAPATEEIVRSLRHAIDDDDLIEELLWNRLRYCEEPIPLNGGS